MFSVVPKKDCPHCIGEHVKPVDEFYNVHVDDECGTCSNVGENWVCLTCQKVFCSRYVQMHMVKHNQETDHPVMFSFADFSYWCYKCEDYLEHELLKHHKYFHYQKFGEGMT